jgi:hypothetical protein
MLTNYSFTMSATGKNSFVRFPKERFFGKCRVHPFEDSIVKTCKGGCERVWATEECRRCIPECASKGYLCDYCTVGAKNKIVSRYLGKSKSCDRFFSGREEIYTIQEETEDVWDIFEFGSDCADVQHGDCIQDMETIQVKWSCIQIGFERRNNGRDKDARIVYTRNDYQLVEEVSRIGYNKFTLRKQDGHFDVTSIKEAFAAIGQEEEPLLRYFSHTAAGKQPAVYYINKIIV